MEIINGLKGLVYYGLDEDNSWPVTIMPLTLDWIKVLGEMDYWLD